MLSRVLIGAAAGVVIVSGTYYLAGRYQAHAEATASADLQQQCDGLLSSLHYQKWSDEEAEKAGECLIGNRITKQQIADAIAVMPAQKFTFEHLGDPSTRPPAP